MVLGTDGVTAMSRGTGETMRQLKTLPKDALFVWLEGNTHYPKQLCKFIERTDIRVVSPDWVLNGNWRGQTFTGMVLDHAYPWGKRSSREDSAFAYALKNLQTRVRP
jgi:hypothetical protein